MMTGTPIENHPSEYFSILSALSHDNLVAKHLASKNELCSPQSLKEVMADVFLRRTKEYVLDELPELNEVSEKVSLERVHLKEHLQLLEEGAHFMSLRQNAIQRDSGESRKLERVVDLIDEYRANGENIVVFSYFKKVLAYIANRYPDVGIIDGNVPGPDRTKLIKKFSTYNPNGNVLAGQIMASGIGLNMQAGSAVILVEPQLNPAIEHQAISRVHRMGQRNTVNVHRIHSIGTIEDGIDEMLDSK
jgi:SNF2 family DNA or RNA helicase